MRLSVMVLCLMGCSSDTADSPVCPDKIADSQETWIYSGSDETCAAIAEEANKDNSGVCDGESSAFTLQAQGRTCIATLVRECDGVTIMTMCEVQPSGAADCKATVAAAEVMCEFKVTER